MHVHRAFLDEHMIAPYLVEQLGAGACHTGRRSCFYRAVPLGKTGAVTLEFRDAEKVFDPNAVYGKK